MSEIEELYKNYVSFADLEEFKKSHQTSEIFDRKYLRRRERLNRKFLKRSAKQTYQMGEYKLDAYQTKAVLACEDATLILAPAGSGKTATLLAKVDYLIRCRNILPAQILVIAFTNKVVEELKERLQNDEVEIRTFHSLGNKIIKAKRPDYKLIAEEASEYLVQRIVLEQLQNHKTYQARYRDLRAGDQSKLPNFIETKPKYTMESFTELMMSAINLQKSERLSLRQLKARLKSEEALQLFALYKPVYQKYQEFLQTKKLYDFADMLNVSTDFVNKMPEGAFDYKYILVDEAQDLSKSKCELLKAVLSKCERVKLFAVGDDWQSIYRFAGSNLKVLNDFEKIFGRKTYRGMIESTYRFGQPTARMSNRFIRKNKFQSKKRVRPAFRKYTPIEYKLYDKQKRAPYASRVSHVPPDYYAVDEILNDLYKEYGDELLNKNLQIISRYNRDVYRLVRQNFRRYRKAKYDVRASVIEWRVRGKILKLPFCTIHKAKGITRDIVIVINMNEGETGMPARRDGNPLLEPMLAAMDNYPFAEERRLFYVAITRAKERTILVAERKHPSRFLLELNPKLLKGRNG